MEALAGSWGSSYSHGLGSESACLKASLAPHHSLAHVLLRHTFTLYSAFLSWGPRQRPSRCQLCTLELLDPWFKMSLFFVNTQLQVFCGPRNWTKLYLLLITQTQSKYCFYSSVVFRLIFTNCSSFLGAQRYAWVSKGYLSTDLQFFFIQRFGRRTGGEPLSHWEMTCLALWILLLSWSSTEMQKQQQQNGKANWTNIHFYGHKVDRKIAKEEILEK